MLDQLLSNLFTAGVPQPPGAKPDLRAQALDILESPKRLRASWTDIMRRLEAEGFEAGEFALICKIYLNQLDNISILLEVSGAARDHLQLPAEKLRSAAAEVKSLQDAIRPLYEMTTRKPSPLDPAKILAAQKKHASEPAVEVGELLRQIHAGEVAL